MHDEKMAVCPVMKNEINKEQAEEKGLVREYKGKKYYFCCDGCPQKFDEDPEKYLEEEHKEENHSEGGCCG